MWPKMLLELLPHFARLVPVADKYFASRGDREKQQEGILTALAASGLSVEEVARAQADVQRTLEAQNAQLAEISLEATRSRMSAERVEQMMGRVERLARVGMWGMVSAVVLLAVAVVLLAAVLVRLHGR